jgi:hypothetical protein
VEKQQACNRWYDTIHKKPKLRTYVVLKTSYEPQNYVKYGFNRKNRSLMAQLRLGILPNNIETGRYTNIPINEILCNHCETIEIETHFVLNCSQYNVAREHLFGKVINICVIITNQIKCIFCLMKCVYLLGIAGQ